MRAAILCIAAACGASGTVATTASLKVQVASSAPACRTAYGEYESLWRVARSEELEEFTAGDAGVVEEILFYELASLPSRAEVTKLREMYAVIDAFLWNAPWPRALAAAESAIEQCGEQIPRPPGQVATGPG